MEISKQKIITCIACGSSPHTFFLNKNGYDLYKCVTCGHIQIYPFNFDTQKIYSEDYFSGAMNGFGYVDYDEDKEPMRNVFEKYLRLIGRSGKLLDVGAATGFFVQIAKNHGYDAHGIEISGFAAELGRKKGLDVKQGTLAGYSAEPGSFDIITAWDVLEHFPNPDLDIEKAHTLLKSGGIIAFNTPDSGSLYARILGKKWHLLVPPEHINYFNRRSVKIFLEKHGFEVVEISTIGKSFTLEYILHTLSAWTKIGFFQKLAHICHGSKFLSKISLPINLHDNMFILAKKS